VRQNLQLRDLFAAALIAFALRDEEKLVYASMSTLPPTPAIPTTKKKSGKEAHQKAFSP